MLTNSLSTFLGNAQANSTASLSPQAKMANFQQAKKMGATEVDKAALDFESLFISQMLEHMFGESLGTELFGNKETSEIYKGLMVEQFGAEIARSGGIGIADYVRAELLKQQEI